MDSPIFDDYRSSEEIDLELGIPLLDADLDLGYSVCVQSEVNDPILSSVSDTLVSDNNVVGGGMYLDLDLEQGMKTSVSDTKTKCAQTRLGSRPTPSVSDTIKKKRKENKNFSVDPKCIKLTCTTVSDTNAKVKQTEDQNLSKPKMRNAGSIKGKSRFVSNEIKKSEPKKDPAASAGDNETKSLVRDMLCQFGKLQDELKEIKEARTENLSRKRKRHNETFSKADLGISDNEEESISTFNQVAEPQMKNWRGDDGTNVEEDVLSIHPNEDLLDLGLGGVESVEEDYEEEEDDILVMIEKEMAMDSKVGPKVHDKLAGIVGKRFSTKMEESQFKLKVDSYKTPENTPTLNPTKINPEILQMGLKKETKREDTRLQAIQRNVARATTAILRGAESMLHLVDTIDRKGIKQLKNTVVGNCLDAVALLGHVQQDLNTRRTYGLYHDLQPQLRGICHKKQDRQVSDLMFGEDCQKLMKEAKEQYRLCHNNGQIKRGGRGFNNSKPFLAGRGRSRGYTQTHIEYQTQRGSQFQRRGQRGNFTRRY